MTPLEVACPLCSVQPEEQCSVDAYPLDPPAIFHAERWEALAFVQSPSTQGEVSEGDWNAAVDASGLV